MPSYIGDLKRDPDLENYPSALRSYGWPPGPVENSPRTPQEGQEFDRKTLNPKPSIFGLGLGVGDGLGFWPRTRNQNSKHNTLNF